MTMNLLNEYKPYLLLDSIEPFDLVAIGYTIMRESGKSPSFRRDIKVEGDTEFVIEYAYYWDYDIQHLYDLEHIWVYVGKNGEILDCEASFHGKYFKSILRDRSNIVKDRHVKLHCQPGKHAFAPIRELYELLPSYDQCTNKNAGEKGYSGNWIIGERYKVDQETDQTIVDYLKSCAFIPTEKYIFKETPDKLFMSWEVLYQSIPKFMKQAVKKLLDEKE